MMCLCVWFFSRHVWTHLLTYTVYSWLGCEPGALQSCAALPHHFLTPTTRGHSLCLDLGVGGGRSAVSLAPFHLRFSAVFSFSSPLSLNSLPMIQLKLIFAFGDADTHRAKEWEREGASVVIDQLFTAPKAAPMLISQPISFHWR